MSKSYFKGTHISGKLYSCHVKSVCTGLGFVTCKSILLISDKGMLGSWVVFFCFVLAFSTLGREDLTVVLRMGFAHRHDLLYIHTFLYKGHEGAILN